MVGVKEREPAELLGQLQEAVSVAVTGGCTLGEIVDSVKDQLITEQQREAQERLDRQRGEYTLSSDGTTKIYFKTPPGLIDLPTAAEKYNRSVRTIQGWVYRGYLQKQALLRSKAPGGAFVLISEDELIAHMSAPPNKGGRHKKHKEA